jgi:uncharacterized protein YgbK (DUF1537 family)
MPLRPHRILAIADDMTGALEVGAKLCALGSLVTTLPEPAFAPRQNVIVMDTETRHFPPERAGAAIDRITQTACSLQVDIVYKKTDSTLRGNIGAEIQAVARAYPEKAIVFIPGYPQLGRTVRRGHLHIDGQLVHRTAFSRDALNPVETSYVPDVLGDGQLPVHLRETAVPGRLEPGHVYIFDSETNADIAAVVDVALAQSPLPVFCGPGSVASCLASALAGCGESLFDTQRTGGAFFRSLLGCSDAPGPVPAVTTALVVNGSRHERADQQIRLACKRGWPVLPARELLNSTARPAWTILDAHGPADEMGAQVAGLLAKIRLDCLVVFGGDTAYSVLRALGVSIVVPVCELFCGVPLSRAGELHLVTKAGGFGPVDLLPKIREALSGGR